MYNNNSNVTNGFNQLTTLLEKSFVKLEYCFIYKVQGLY